MSCITHVLYVYCVELSKCEELIKFYLSVYLSRNTIKVRDDGGTGQTGFNSDLYGCQSALWLSGRLDDRRKVSFVAEQSQKHFSLEFLFLLQFLRETTVISTVKELHCRKTLHIRKIRNSEV